MQRTESMTFGDLCYYEIIPESTPSVLKMEVIEMKQASIIVSSGKDIKFVETE